MTTRDGVGDVEKRISQILDFMRANSRLDSTDAARLVLGLFTLKCVSDLAGNEEVAEEYKSVAGLILPAKFTWSSIRDDWKGRELCSAIEAIEQHPANRDRGLGMFWTELGLPRMIQGLSQRQVAEVIRSLDAIDLRAFDSAERGRALDWLLERSAELHGVYGDVHYTPSELSKLLAEILNPPSGCSIYDPVCGTGSLLWACYRKAQETGGQQPPPRLYGQDISSSTAALARISLMLHGISEFDIRTGDTLVDPCFVDKNGLRLQCFDYAIGNPPPNVPLRDVQLENIRKDHYSQFSYGVPRKTSDYAFLQHILASTGEQGRAVVVMSLGALVREGEEALIRRKLVDDDVVEAVVSLPGGWLMTSAISISIVVLNKSKSPDRKGKTLFIYADEVCGRPGELSSAGSGEQWKRDSIVENLRSFSSKHRFSAVVSREQIAKEAYALAPVRYVDVLNLTSFLGGKFDLHDLRSLGDVQQGTRLSQDAYGAGGGPVIRGRDLSGARISVDDLATATPRDVGRVVYARTDDVLVQRIGLSPKAYLVTNELNGVLVGDTVFVVRLNEEYRMLGQYLAEFINAPIGQGLLSRLAGGSAVIPTLTLKELRKLRIPIPDSSVVDLIGDMRRVEQKISGRLDAARQLRARLFSIEDTDRVSQELQALRTETQVLAASLVQSDDLDFQIRNFYPLPLAFPYRATAALGDPAEQYQEGLRIAENVLAFLGSLGLMVADALNLLEQSHNENLSAEKLKKSWGGGISPGDWKSLVQESARQLRPREDSSIASSFSSLWYRGKKESEIAAVFSRLVEVKNDFKHDRGPRTSVAYQEQLPYLRNLLEAAYRGLRFLVQYPIRYVLRTDMNWKTRKIEFETLIYSGDHPGLRKERCLLDNLLPNNKLYIETKSGEWVSLYPLFSVQYCPSCQTRETYFIDRWDGPGKRIVLKSFERGHTLDSTEMAKEVADDLEDWMRTRVMRAV